MILVGGPVRPADRVEVKAALGRLTLAEGHITTLNAERVSPARTAAAGAAGICQHKKDNYQNNNQADLVLCLLIGAGISRLGRSSQRICFQFCSESKGGSEHWGVHFFFTEFSVVSHFTGFC